MLFKAHIFLLQLFLCRFGALIHRFRVYIAKSFGVEQLGDILFGAFAHRDFGTSIELPCSCSFFGSLTLM
jgi:hypothetical protein